jgi:hypothetical protein
MRFIEAERVQGRDHTRATLEQLKPGSLSRMDVRAGLAWLQTRGRVWDEPVRSPDGKAPRAGSRTRLRVGLGGEASARPEA